MNDGMDGDVDPDVAGQIMSLMLDCADPANARDDRDAAFEQAMELNPTVTAVLASGYLRVVLNALRDQFGPDAAAFVVSQLASGSVALLDSDGDS